MRLIYDIRPRPKMQKMPKRNYAFRYSGIGRIGRTAGWFARVFAIGLLAAVVFGAGSDFASAPQLQAERVVAQSRAPTQEELELEEKLKATEEKIKEYEENIEITQKEGRTLKSEINALENKIKKLNLQIQSTDIQIAKISSRLRDTQSAIYESQLKISEKKDLLGKSLRALYEADQVSMLELMMADTSIAEFFADMNALYALQLRTRAELDQVKALREVLERQKIELLDAKEDQVALLLVQTTQKNDVDSAKKTKDQLLALTKGKETLFQQLRQQAQKSAAEIRAQLYKLRGGGELRFEEALKYAQFASTISGVRPALLLAVLSQESNLGKNVGRCSWRSAMHPTRDQPVYLQVTQELGIDPDSMLVSCPISSDGTYGGAMGIAQFLPSTWVLYKDRVRGVVGHVPSPWNPRDAFVATAFYLADAGASSQTYAAERQAAAKYYAGGRWRYYLRSYGDRVMNLAGTYQEEIDILGRSAIIPSS